MLLTIWIFVILSLIFGGLSAHFQTGYIFISGMGLFFIFFYLAPMIARSTRRKKFLDKITHELKFREAKLIGFTEPNIGIYYGWRETTSFKVQIDRKDYICYIQIGSVLFGLLSNNCTVLIKDIG